MDNSLFLEKQLSKGSNTCVILVPGHSKDTFGKRTKPVDITLVKQQGSAYIQEPVKDYVFYEYAFNAKLASEVSKFLKEEQIDFIRINSINNPSKQAVTVANAVNLAKNSHKLTYVISFHANAIDNIGKVVKNSDRGLQIYYNNESAKPYSERLVKYISDSFVKTKVCGVTTKSQSWAIMRVKTTNPIFLTENGFFQNYFDLQDLSA